MPSTFPTSSLFSPMKVPVKGAYFSLKSRIFSAIDLYLLRAVTSFSFTSKLSFSIASLASFHALKNCLYKTLSLPPSDSVASCSVKVKGIYTPLSFIFLVTFSANSSDFFSYSDNAPKAYKEASFLLAPALTSCLYISHFFETSDTYLSSSFAALSEASFIALASISAMTFRMETFKSLRTSVLSSSWLRILFNSSR